MNSLTTPRLVIRNFTVNDADALHTMILQYASSVYAQYDHPWPTDITEIRKVTEWFASADDYLAVCLKENGDLIGLVAKNPGGDPDAGEYSLGYIFNFNYHGQGYATEACQAVLDFLFNVLGADHIASGTAVANAPSCRLLTRLGFQIVSEGKSSFHTSDEGSPIEFASYHFVLYKTDWLTKSEIHSNKNQKNTV